MKQKMSTALLVSGFVLAVTGCTSMTIGDNTIKQRSGMALGVDSQSITIDHRSDGVLRSDFQVESQGKTYRCYMTSFLGLANSDAICNGFDASKTPASNKESSSSKSSCNALTKAAGKC